MTGREGNLRRAVQFGIGRTAGIGLSQNAPNIKTKNLKKTKSRAHWIKCVCNFYFIECDWIDDCYGVLRRSDERRLRASLVYGQNVRGRRGGQLARDDVGENAYDWTRLLGGVVQNDETVRGTADETLAVRGEDETTDSLAVMPRKEKLFNIQRRYLRHLYSARRFVFVTWKTRTQPMSDPNAKQLRVG